MSRHPAIKRAEAATDATEEQIAIATRALTADRWVNGFGVYNDRGGVHGRLHDAKVAIEAALKSVSSCDWPTNEEYEASQ